MLRYADSVTGLDAAWAESCGNLQLPMDVAVWSSSTSGGRAWGGLISMVVVAVVLAGCGEWPGFALPEGKKLPAWDVAVSDPRPAVKAGDREEVVLRAPELGLFRRSVI